MVHIIIVMIYEVIVIIESTEPSVYSNMIWAYDENASSAMVTLEVCSIPTSYMSSCKQVILTTMKKYVRL
jgi:hypothetical protein